MALPSDLLTCSVCLDEFKDPRALPCLHTFCQQCILHLFATADVDDITDTTLACPICKECHELPNPGGVCGFRQDFRIKSLMEMNEKKGSAVKTTTCKRHPRLELTHFCLESKCNRAVLCSQCVQEKHRNHQIKCAKSVRVAKLSHLNVMKQAIKENKELIQSARRKLSNNQCEMLNEVKAGMARFRAKLDELEKKITDEVNFKAYEEQVALTMYEDDLDEAEVQLESLEATFSDTIPNIVRANADKQLDKDFDRLHKTLSNWSLKYTLLQTDVTSVRLAFSRNPCTDWVVKLPGQAVQGVPIVFARPEVPPVKVKEAVTWTQKDDNVCGIACYSYGGGGVTISSNSHLRVYKQNEGKIFHSTEHEDDVCNVATFRGCNHAVLDRKRDEVRLYYNVGKQAIAFLEPRTIWCTAHDKTPWHKLSVFQWPLLLGVSGK